MQKTLSDINTDTENAFTELLDELVMQVTDNVPDEAAEEYADEQGYEESDEAEDEGREFVSESDVRGLLISAYNAGRDAAVEALKEAVEEAK